MCYATTLLWTMVLLNFNDPSSERGVDVRCGGYCLFVGLKALGFEIRDYSALESRLGPPGRLGYSIEDLSKAAESYRAQVAGVETSIARLQERTGRFACIALLDRGHFVLVYDVRDGLVFVADPPDKSTISVEAFQVIWNGKALLISDQPIVPESQIHVASTRPGYIAYSFSALFLIAAVALGIRHACRLRRT
jgi:ABC-type bacteriocin/lantibiotic exporter with double-glycine peptidase domain